MRMFIAVKPDEDSIRKIILLQNDLKKMADGNWTEERNLHLTMAFLGETKEDKIPELKELLSCIPFKGCRTEGSHIGAFQGKNGDLIFLGIKENAELAEAHNELAMLLKKKEYPVENRCFLPHITVGRHVHMKTAAEGNLKKIMPICFSSMHLYSSKIEEGRRIYREL